MVSVTENAARQVHTLIQQEGKEGHNLRIGVNGGGCSGLEYYLALDSDVHDDDEVAELEGFKLLVDRRSLPYLDGASLDFSNDLMNSGFIFNNPNAARTCGCGKSFCG